MFKKRLAYLYAGILAAILIVGARLLCLQVVQVSGEDPDAVLQRRSPFEEIPQYRGAILDRNGLVLARDEPMLALAVQYRALGKPELWLDQANRLTGRGTEELLRERDAIVRRVERIRAAIPARVAVIYEQTIPHVIASGLSVEAAARLEADPVNLPDEKAWRSPRGASEPILSVQVVHTRVWPSGNVASQAVGYIGKAQAMRERDRMADEDVRAGDRVGLTGVEKQYDRLLRGVPGVAREETQGATGARERKIMFAALPGRTLTLTLDSAVQRKAEEQLAGRVGGAVVMDVKTGELLALAGSPSYDMTNLATGFQAARDDPSSGIFLSWAIQGSVAPGSTVKPIVALAAARGGIRPDMTVTCAGSLRVAGREFTCSARHGTVNMEQAIAHSCNVYFYEMGRRIGPDIIAREAASFGYGRKTGVDLPYERPGKLPDRTPQSRGRWFVGDTLNLSIGQGDLQVTPIQAAMEMAVVANGGRAPRPRVLLRVLPPLDRDEEADETPADQVPPETTDAGVLPQAALDAVRAGMKGAAIFGTAREIEAFRTHKAAVKTGTAETADPRKNHAWVAGYVPWDAPRYVFAVVIHNTPRHGADEAGPVAAAILDTLFGPRREALAPATAGPPPARP